MHWTEYEHSDSGIVENRGDRDLEDFVNAQQLFPPQVQHNDWPHSHTNILACINTMFIGVWIASGA